MKISKRVLFWGLQIFGWAIPAMSTILIKLSFKVSLSNEYIITEGTLLFIAGIIGSLLIRIFVKDRVSYETLTIKTILASIVVLLVVSGVITYGLIASSTMAYEILESKEMPEGGVSVVGNFMNLFILLFIWINIYLSYKSVKKSRENKLERLQLEATLKESQLNTLKGQINPHFMFNSLNNIRGLMLEDVGKSRDMLTKLSELLRYSLNSNKVDTISLKQELDTVRNYIGLSKIQFEKRLLYEEEIENDILEYKIPPMLIQMLIENAIKHGISEEVSGGKVCLHLYRKEIDLYIIVYNTGTLKASISPTNIGVQNSKDRLRLLYGTKASFDLTEVGNMVKATIKIPIDD